jgi:outer membrane protein assembly factor BamB
MREDVRRRELLRAAAAAGALSGAPGVATATGGRRGAAGRPASEGGQAVGGWPTHAHDAANTGHAPANVGPTGAVARRWQFRAAGEGSSAPTVVDGTVYVGSPDGYVDALEAADGTRQWRTDLLTDVRPDDRNFFEVESAPTVVDGTVYVGSPEEDVYALSAADGSVRWRFPTDNGVTAAPAVVDGTVYVGSLDDHVYALDAADGTEQWRFRTEQSVSSKAAVVDSTVYASSADGNLYALSAADGTEQWRFEASEESAAPTVVDVSADGGGSSDGSDGGTVYLTTQPGLVAVDAADGTLQWEFETDFGGKWSPAVAEGVGPGEGATVYFGTAEATVYALSAADGAEHWRVRTDAEVRSALAVVGDTLYVCTDDSGSTGSADRGSVYALSAADGSQRWRHETAAGVSSSPAVVGGTLYVGTDESGLVALSDVDAPSTATVPSGDDAGSATPGTAGEVGGIDPVEGVGQWLSGWRLLVAWVGAVTVLAPLVLGAAVALEDRLRGWRTPDDDRRDGE